MNPWVMVDMHAELIAASMVASTVAWKSGLMLLFSTALTSRKSVSLLVASPGVVFAVEKANSRSPSLSEPMQAARPRLSAERSARRRHRSGSIGASVATAVMLEPGGYGVGPGRR